MGMARLLAIGTITLGTLGHGAWAQAPGNAAQPPRQQAADPTSRLETLTRQLERVSQENHALRAELAKRGMVVEFGESLGAPQFDINFPGGTVTELVQKIKEINPRANVILGQYVAELDIMVGPFEAFGVTDVGALDIARRLITSDHEIEVRADRVPGDSSSPVVTVHLGGAMQDSIMRSRRPERDLENAPSRAWNLHTWVGGNSESVQAALAALAVGSELDNSRVIMKLHEPTGVLVARGPASKLALMDEILRAVAERPGVRPESHRDQAVRTLLRVRTQLVDVESEISVLEAQRRVAEAKHSDLEAMNSNQEALALQKLRIAEVDSEIARRRYEQERLRDEMLRLEKIISETPGD